MIKFLEKEFTLENEDILQAVRFAELATISGSQSVRDFGSEALRGKNDQIADISEGKMAEIAFSKFLKKNFDIVSDVDFNHYQDVKITDMGNDVESISIEGRSPRTSLFKVDVKTTKPYSQWLLVEGHKFWANVYVLVKVDLPRGYEVDPYSFLGNPIKTEVVGFAYYTDFIDPESKKPWIKYSCGDFLIHPNYLKFGTYPEPLNVKALLKTPGIRTLGSALKSSTNYGLPISWLRSDADDWKGLVEIIKASSIIPGDIIRRK